MNQSIPFSSKFKGVYCLVIGRQKNQIGGSKKMNNQEQHVSLNPVIALCPLKVPLNITWIQLSRPLITHHCVPLRLVIQPTVRGMNSRPRELFPLNYAGGWVNLQLQASKNVSVTARFLQVHFSCQRNDSAEYWFCYALGVALGGSHHQ